MKKQTLILVVTIVLLFALVMMLTACDVGENSETDHKHSFSNETITKPATYNADGEKTLTCSCGETRTEKIESLTPTSDVVADGISSSKNEKKQNYDFDITLTGNVTILGFSGSADGSYSGKYRYDTESGSLKFMRETSGKLLFDAREYIYNKGSSRVVINTDTSNNIKKISVAQDEDGLSLLNRPFLAVVQALEANNINSIEKNASGKYRFSAKMVFAGNSMPITLLLNKIASMGSTISIKDVNFDNPQGGIALNFNVTDDGVLRDFTYSFHIDFPVAGQRVAIELVYTQNPNDKDFNVPALEGYLTGASSIGSELTAINNSISAVRNSETYSVDLDATNEFDAGWNKLAVVDKYEARMYKNAKDDREDFNHSYVYKSHTEEDGKESFKYTVGNVVEDGKVYEISRKGSNVQRELEDVTAASRFDLLTSFASLDAESVDFIKKETGKEGETIYTVFVNNASSVRLQKDILALLNSNTAEGVIPVDNYLDEQNFTIESSECVLTVKDGKFVSAIIAVELRYTPIGGEYTDRVVTLENSVEIKIDKEFEDASKYEAPNKVNSTLTKAGLNSSKFYIL